MDRTEKMVFSYQISKKKALGGTLTVAGVGGLGSTSRVPSKAYYKNPRQGMSQSYPNFLASAICFLNFTFSKASHPRGTPLVRQLEITLGFTSSFSASRATPPAALIAMSSKFMPVYITSVMDTIFRIDTQIKVKKSLEPSQMCVR
jgi:hypothetical protein